MDSAVAILIMVLLTIAVPLWLILHYVTRWKTSKGLSAEESRVMEELWEMAQTMETRIQSLETILEFDENKRSDNNEHNKS